MARRDGYCIEDVSSRGGVWGGMTKYPCSKKAKYPAEDPKYCGTHDPERVAKREAKKRAKWKAESDASDRRSKMKSLAHQCVTLLADGKITEAGKVAKEWKALRDGKTTDG